MNADERPITVDLARESDFALGRTTIRPSLRQVETDGASETLEPRVMQVLVALARRQGDVVSRDELIAACWGGRIVGEDAITRSVNRVRRVGEATGAFSLETIPRVGYRLLEARAASAAPVAEDAAAPETPQPAGQGDTPAATRRRRLMWALVGALGAVALVAVLAWNLSTARQDMDVDQVVARLSDRLRADVAARPGDIQQVEQALHELGDSSRLEERSAFAALVSNDGKHALDILEDLARQLEAGGDPKAASAAWRRLGALAVTEDRGRGLLAQRRAFDLDPGSLGAFQNLFFMNVVAGPQNSIAFANHVLDDLQIDERMRGWALSHRAFAEADWIGDSAAGRATLAELKALRTYAADPILEASALWIEGMLAANAGDLREARRLAELGTRAWTNIPEKTSNSPEIIRLRMMYEQGDWAGMFAEGGAVFDRRAREGDLLPGVITLLLCEAGVLTGQSQRALPYCRSVVHRSEGPPAQTRGLAALIAGLDGDAALAAREFEHAYALAPPAGSMPAMILIHQAVLTHRLSGPAEAERMLLQSPSGATWEQATERRRSVLAMRQRLRGEWLIAAGQPAQACLPLAEAERIYDEIGGEPGRAAVRTLRGAAGCP